MLKYFSKVLFISLVLVSMANSQERLPHDNGIFTYHPAPNYRESESHPLRIVAYIVHPIGWLLREGIFRPWSYLMSSDPTVSSVFGYRQPYDFRAPSSCFANTDVPDCRKTPPYNFIDGQQARMAKEVDAPKEIFFSDVNFDFDKRNLNDIGRAKAHEVAELIKQQPVGVKIILEGHTDKRGGDTYNNKLGMDRAVAVQTELVNLGVTAANVSTVTFGETKPKINEDNEAAYSANRRVEVKFDNKAPEAAVEADK